MSTKSGSEFLDHLHEVARPLAILTLGVDDKKASEFALHLVAQISAAWGGVSVYISQELAREFRDRAIVADFDGANYVHLARKYRLSERRVRAIIANQQQDARQSRGLG